MKYFLILMIFFSFSCHAQTRIDPSQSKAYVGKSVTVCGKIYGSYQSLRSKGQPTFLDMGGKYPNATFTVLVWGDDLSKFDYSLNSLVEKTVCVTGLIKLYRDKPEIIVSDPSQIKITN